MSGDKVLGAEIINKENIHTNNQNAFGLPSRLIAKVFKFRLIYGGSAYSYAHDPDFMAVSKDERFWQDVIDRYYRKYYGIGEWHERLVYEAQSTGRLEIPSGRYYPITPDYSKRNPWPLTIIKNYPVQGFGADLVKLARLRANQLLDAAGIEARLVCTIHDSIVVDTEAENVYNVCKLLKQAIEEVPRMVREIWDYNFVLPLTCEIQFGENKADMMEFLYEDGFRVVKEINKEKVYLGTMASAKEAFELYKRN